MVSLWICRVSARFLCRIFVFGFLATPRCEKSLCLDGERSLNSRPCVLEAGAGEGSADDLSWDAEPGRSARFQRDLSVFDCLSVSTFDQVIGHANRCVFICGEREMLRNEFRVGSIKFANPSTVLKKLDVSRKLIGSFRSRRCDAIRSEILKIIQTSSETFSHRVKIMFRNKEKYIKNYVSWWRCVCLNWSPSKLFKEHYESIRKCIEKWGSSLPRWISWMEFQLRRPFREHLWIFWQCFRDQRSFLTILRVAAVDLCPVPLGTFLESSWWRRPPTRRCRSLCMS